MIPAMPSTPAGLCRTRAARSDLATAGDLHRRRFRVAQLVSREEPQQQPAIRAQRQNPEARQQRVAQRFPPLLQHRAQHRGTQSQPRDLRGEAELWVRSPRGGHGAEVEEGGEPVLTDLMDFFLYCSMDPVYSWKRLGGRVLPALTSWFFIRRVESLRKAMRQALKGSRFLPVSRIGDLASSVRGIISRGNQAGEGWLLTAEMLELIDHGVNNVLCLQPFGCLPNHTTGKGVMKELKRLRPHANLMAVDYDPGSSEANQLNRIKLFMSVAHTGLEQQGEASCPETPCPGAKPAEQRETGRDASAQRRCGGETLSPVRAAENLACRACSLAKGLQEPGHGVQS